MNSRPRAEMLIVLLLVVALAGAALLYVMSGRQYGLRSGPVGFDGLQDWLVSQGSEAQSFAGGWTIDQSTVGLLVLPMFDSDLNADRTAPGTREELAYQQDETDLTLGVIRAKVRAVPTLIILPKWRSGMRLTGLAHPDMLIDPARVQQVLRAVSGVDTAQLRYARTAFTDLPYDDLPDNDLTARLYAAQLMRLPGCEAVIGTAERMLLAECPVPDTEARVLILSDPDLMNNHGLRLADNALISNQYLSEKAGEKRILIDYSQRNWLVEPRDTVARARRWADLLRFVQPPFLTLWIGAAVVFALALWRAARRAGPLRRLPPPQTGNGLLARARLMRLADQDGEMLRAYMVARLAAAYARIVGPAQARRGADGRAYVTLVHRRWPAHGAALAQAIAAIHALPDCIPANVAIQHVDAFEQILDRIAQEETS